MHGPNLLQILAEHLREKKMIWIACGAVVVLAGFFVLAPLFKEPKGNLEQELSAETEGDRLLDRKAVLYGNLKDLELEYAMGRLSDADFHQLATGYKNEAAAILQRLDQLGGAQNPDSAAEKEIAMRTLKRHGSGSAEARDLSRCPSCGAKIIPGKKFCADCGRRF
jgi:hypothetical protein